MSKSLWVRMVRLGLMKGSKNGFQSLTQDVINGYHVVPDEDIAEHEATPACWCQPRFDGRDLGTGEEVWVHRCAMEEPQ